MCIVCSIKKYINGSNESLQWIKCQCQFLEYGRIYFDRCFYFFFWVGGGIVGLTFSRTMRNLAILQNFLNISIKKAVLCCIYAVMNKCKQKSLSDWSLLSYFFNINFARSFLYFWFLSWHRDFNNTYIFTTVKNCCFEE